MKRSLLPCLGCCLALVAAAGCNRSTKPRVAFVTNNPEAFWNIAEAGAKKAAAESDVELYFRKPASSAVTAQQEVISTVLNQGVKAVAVSVINPKNQTDYLNEVADQAALLAVDNDAPKSKRLAYIGTDNYKAGRVAGKLVKEALGEAGGSVLFFVGTLDSLNAVQRRQGVIDEVLGNEPPADLNNITRTPDGASAGKYKILRTYEDAVEPKRAKENADDALNALPAEGNVCMVGLYAYNPPGIRTAIADLGDAQKRKRLSIVGFDEYPATLDGVKDGSIYATVVQDPYNFGYQSVKLMAALAKGDRSGLPKGGILDVPVRVVAKEAGEKNGLKRLAVDPFRAELDKLMGK